MSHHLIELEKKAFALKNAGRDAEAIEVLSAIIEEQPDWEHGNAYLFRAECYENVGKLVLAEENYRAALRYEPENMSFLGGLASFLYQYGKPEDAFSAYLDILVIDKRHGDEDGLKRTMIGLKALGQKLGLSEAEVADRIREKGEL